MRLSSSLLSRLLAGMFALGLASLAYAQRPYIGFVYPAGGQQGTTFQVRLGGQALNDLDDVIVSGQGVTARIVDYLPRLNNQEVVLLREQLVQLRRSSNSPAPAPAMDGSGEAMMMMMAPAEGSGAKSNNPRNPGEVKAMMERLQARVADFVQNPACASASNIAVVEVTVAADAEPGEREIRLSTIRGVSNPLVFEIGTLREYSAPPMSTSPQQILGREAQALRKRGPKDGDSDVQLPCTVNGQLGPGEINRFHFHARKGQQLVFSAECRHLIPYIADAVPGWFQAVLSLYDSKGREVSYDDDYGFRPDPVVIYKVPEDGDYTLAIHDAIYRGREDFIYRMSLGELPFITSCFPAGGQPGKPVSVTFAGVNIPESQRQRIVTFDAVGVHSLTVRSGAQVSNPVPFAVETLPTVRENEKHDTDQTAQAISGAVIIDGRIGHPGETDVFRVSGRAGEMLAVEVMARRLDSPLDSFVTVSNAQGKLIALNDDSMDFGDGVNTHHADSYLIAKLPETGDYFVRLIDRARQGGPQYLYRLRIGAPQPDFELRVVPSSLAVRYNSVTAASVYVLRKDDYDGPVRLSLDNPPPGFSAQPVIVPKGQTVGRLQIRAPARPTRQHVTLRIAGTARMGGRDHVRIATGAEDKMQAFLWRHLVPAGEFVVDVFDPAYVPPSKRVVPELKLKPAPAAAVAVASTPAPGNAATVAALTTTVTAPGTAPTTPATTASATTAAATDASKPKFTKQQVAGRLRQLRTLYEAGLLTDSFYLEKVEECETAF